MRKMKVRNLSKLTLALLLSGSLVLDSCKKYDSDITRLEESINKNASDITSLKNQLNELSKNYVVTDVKPVSGGFDITLKDFNGNTSSYSIRNGEDGKDGNNGEDGKDGKDGRDGIDGRDGTMFEQRADGFWWVKEDGKDWSKTNNEWKGKDGKDGINGKDGKDGKDGNDGKDGKDGINGKDGKDGTVITIVDQGGKKVWAADGVPFTPEVIAYPGEVLVTAVTGGYNVIFTDIYGNATDAIFLHKEAVAVSSLSLVPQLTNSNSPVILFPRIVSQVPSTAGNIPTLMQGYGVVKYNLNPYGVNTDYYNAIGFLTESTTKVSFRNTGTGAAVSDKFEIVGEPAKTFGDITLKVKPTDNTALPRNNTDQDLFLALQLENNKAESTQKYVASPFNLAKEELIEKDEVTIERAVKSNDKYNLHNAWSTAGYNIGSSSFVEAGVSTVNTSITQLAAQNKTNPHYILNVYNNAENNIDGRSTYEGGIDLKADLRGFFARTQMGHKIVSMDDNGLEGYDLRFGHISSIYGSGNWLHLDNNGVIKVRESTPNQYNTGAVGNFAIVRVRLFPTTSSSASDWIAERYIKIGFSQTAAAPIDLKGNVSHTLTAPASVTRNVSWIVPTTLDAAYNTTGKTAVDFHTVYTFTPDASNPAGFGFVDMDNTTQATPRRISIDQTAVNPGTYTLKGQYVSSVSTDPVVNVEIKVTVSLNGTVSYKPINAYWENGAMRMYGKAQGTNNWMMSGDMNEYITLDNTVAGPNVTWNFSINDVNHQFVAKFGGNNSSAIINSLGGENLHIVNPSSPQSNPTSTRNTWRYINGWDFNSQYNAVVNVNYYLNGNPTAFKTETIPVRFKNPVRAILAKNNATGTVTDKANGSSTQDIDLRQFIELQDYQGVTIWKDGGIGTISNSMKTLLDRYGVIGLDRNILGTPTLATGQVTPVKAFYTSDASESAITLPANTSFTVVTGTNNQTYARWINSGATTITQGITLVYEIKIPNRYNDGSAPNSNKDIVQEVRIKVLPNN